MANYNALTAATMDRVVKLGKVFNVGEVAEMLGISVPSVYTVLRADRNAANGDREKLVEVPSATAVKWAAKKYGIDLAPKLLPKEEKPVEAAPPKTEEKKHDARNDELVFVKILTALDAINAKLADMGAALNRMNGRLANIENAATLQIDKDTLNANFNLLFSELKGAQ